MLYLLAALNIFRKHHQSICALAKGANSLVATPTSCLHRPWPLGSGPPEYARAAALPLCVSVKLLMHNAGLAQLSERVQNVELSRMHTPELTKSCVKPYKSLGALCSSGIVRAHLR